MAVPDPLQSLYTSVYTDHDGPVIAGIVVTAMGGFLSAFFGIELLLFATPLTGGLVAGFLFGKYWKHTAGIGFRVGVIGAVLVIGVSLLLMAGGFWTLTWGPENVGVVGIYEGEPGTEGFDSENPDLKAFETGISGAENGTGEEIAAETSMAFLIVFSVGVLIPASAVLAMIGCVVGTNVRRAVVPDEYNPPLF